MTTPTPAKPNYKATLNLPQTPFAMEAKLVQNEPRRLEAWRAAGLYEKLMTARAAAPRWILHDGPPFANGDIHIGHVLNKTLKDVILRFRSMQGRQAPYVPGWDCHGLPIEQKIQDELGPKIREMGPGQIRELCFAHASKFARLQSEQFQRLGILGQWDRPYLTMSGDYEAHTLEVFSRFVAAGLVYKKLKPVYWSVANQTALADADVEYKDVEGPSIFVEFPDAAQSGLYYIVWTTTPWTLSANLAIAVHPDVEYAFVNYSRNGESRIGVVAAPLVQSVFGEREGIERFDVERTVSGKDLLGRKYRHPFIDRTSAIVPADYVTTSDGTGLVHTAPGHGVDDYMTGLAQGLEIYSPVLHNGRYDETVPEWLRGLNVWKADPLITQRLSELGLLLHAGRISHSYPHDERSKTPIIFRATEQWFIAVDKPFPIPSDAAEPADATEPADAGDAINPRDAGNRADPGPPRSLRDRALDAVENQVRFIPGWGKARLTGMLSSRPDWCISRQRAWGLPIPVFYNESGQPLLTPESVRAVARHFHQHGSNSWFTDSPEQILGEDFVCPDGFDPTTLRKEQDIFDVWFESGSSWHAVLEARPNLSYPADLYLEGSDQHRGWFQLSMLPALGASGRPPFKQVLTHGFIVGPDGRKKSKRDKDYVTATQEINSHGADLLRLWCCSNDYQGDVTASPELIRAFGDKYRKIRNTLRYLLSNLYDFDPATDALEVPLNSLDGWASAELDELIRQTIAAYDGYQLHRAYRALHDFCAVQISAVYANALKDRLYCELPESPLRRRCQTVMHRMLMALTKLLAPMIVFTADEAWESIAHRPGTDAALSSVHLSLLPEPSGVVVTPEQREEWRLLMELRTAALAQLDALTRQIGKYKALDAEVIYHVDDDDLRSRLQAYGPDLEDLIGAGCHQFAEAPESAPTAAVRLVDRRELYKACARSWKRRGDVGQDAEFPDLSLRDADAVRKLQSRR